MKEETEYAFRQLKDALIKLREGAEKAEDELDKDGVIQRFEFTFELLWKALKIFLEDSGIEAKTPKESLKQAFRIGWLREDTVFLDMLKDRNMTSHIYDKETSEEIFERIKATYLLAMEGVLERLK